MCACVTHYKTTFLVQKHSLFKFALGSYGGFVSIFLKCYFFSLRKDYFPVWGSVYFMLISMLVYWLFKDVISTKVKLAPNVERLPIS